jgi:hypothetical protein
MSYSSTILADTPIAYYRLNELSSNIAHDSSGNGYDAKLTGTFSFGHPGPMVDDSDMSILFDGLTGTMTLPYTLNYTTFSAISIEFWINVTGTWQYIVVTCDNTTTLIYANDALTTTSSMGIIEIGSIFDFFGTYLSAYMAKSAIYNYVLSPTKISTHYTSANTHYALFPTIKRRTGTFAKASRRTGILLPVSRRTGQLPPAKRRLGTFLPIGRRTGQLLPTKRRTGTFSSISRRTGTFTSTKRRVGVFTPTRRRTGGISLAKRRIGILPTTQRRIGPFPAISRRQTQ